MNKEFLKHAVSGMDLHLVGTEANSAVFLDALRLAQNFLTVLDKFAGVGWNSTALNPRYIVHNFNCQQCLCLWLMTCSLVSLTMSAVQLPASTATTGFLINPQRETSTLEIMVF